MTSSGTSYPVATVVNKSGVDVEIFDVFDASDGAGTGRYTYTSLAKIADGGQAQVQTVHFSSQLLAVHDGTVAAVNNNYYAGFPVAVLPVSVLDDSTLKQTITADDKTGIEQAFLFSRYSQANADSNLTKQFVAALGSDDQEKAVDHFFAGTANFSKASLSAWYAVTAWQSQFLSAWQGPVYLYQNDAAAKNIRLVAVVNIVSSAQENSAKVYIADQNGNYSSSSQNTDIAPTGNGTISEKDVGVAPVSLTLTPVWMNISTVDAKGAVSYAIGCAMSGTVNGVKVMGTGQKLAIPGGSGGSSSSGNWYDQFSKAYSLTLSTFGMLSSLGMLFIMFKQWKGEKTSKADSIVDKSTDPKAEESQLKADQAQSDLAVDQVRQPEAAQRVAQTQAAVEPLSSTVAEAAGVQQEIEATKVIEVQSQKITELLKEAPPSDKTEDAVAEILAAKESIDNGEVDTAFQNLKKSSTTISEMAQETGSKMTESQKAEAETIRQDIEASEQTQQDIQEKQEEQEKLNEQEPSEDIPESRVTEEAPTTSFGE